MKRVSLFHAGGGDWTGMYFDGELVMENHSLSEVEMLVRLSEYLGFEFTNLYSEDDELDRYGNSCPFTWAEIEEKENL